MLISETDGEVNVDIGKAIRILGRVWRNLKEPRCQNVKK